MKNYPIDEALFLLYVEIIFQMDRFRFMPTVSIYSELNKRRHDLHEKLLNFAQTTREDDEFSYFLAEKVEKELELLKKR